MGLRFLAAAVLVVILAYLVRGWLRRLADRNVGAAQPSLTRTVRCAHCGTFVAREAAVESDGHFYCSTRHATEAADQDAGG